MAINKIIYIAGLGHSGSTILDMSLGCHPMIIGVGEINNLFKATRKDFNSEEFNRILCSCGKDMDSCSFWKGAKRLLIRHYKDTKEAKYIYLVNYINQQFGNESILVDSSKNPHEYLSFLNNRFDLRIIFLVRDIRSWCFSRHCRHGTNLLRLAYLWFKGNVKLNRFLINNKLRFMKLGYEELALYPEFMLKEICDFIDIDYSPLMLEPNKTKSHIIRGNVARGDSVKRKAFFYDARWFTSIQLAILGPLISPILRWNNQNVYSHFVQGKTKAFGVPQKDFIIFGDSGKEQVLRKRDKISDIN